MRFWTAVILGLLAALPAWGQQLTLAPVGTFKQPLGQPSGFEAIEVDDCDGDVCLAVDLDGLGPNSTQGRAVIPSLLDGQRTTWYGNTWAPYADIINETKDEEGWQNKAAIQAAPVPIGGGRYVTICAYDFYLPSVDHATHCFYDRNTGEVKGPYYIGTIDDPLIRLKKNTYLTRVPQSYADEHYGAGGEPWCFSGWRRPGPGGFYYREPVLGHTLVAHPCGWPEAPPYTEIVPAILEVGYWFQSPFSTATGELAGTLRLPPDPEEPFDFPFNNAGVKGSDVAAGSMVADDGTRLDVVFFLIRNGSQWYEYHDDTRPLWNCLKTAAQFSDCYPAIEPNRQRNCPPSDSIPGTEEPCAPLFANISATWDSRGKDPLFNELGPEFVPELHAVDSCELNKGYGGTFPATDWRGDGGGYNLEIWGYNLASFNGGLTAEDVRNPSLIPQPFFRYAVLRRTCGARGGIAFDGANKRLYVSPGAGPEMLVFDVTADTGNPEEQPLPMVLSVDIDGQTFDGPCFQTLALTIDERQRLTLACEGGGELQLLLDTFCETALELAVDGQVVISEDCSSP